MRIPNAAHGFRGAAASDRLKIPETILEFFNSNLKTPKKLPAKGD